MRDARSHYQHKSIRIRLWRRCKLGTYPHKQATKKYPEIRNTRCREFQGGCDGSGYGLINYKGKKDKTHRVAYKLKIGEIDANLDVCHKCDNPPCCNPLHLFTETHKANCRDAFDKSRQPIGEDHGNSKLTNKQVLRIRKLYKTGLYTQQELSDLFGVSRRTIGNIVNRLVYRHI